MSHFTVAVFTKVDQKIEDLLAPYQENNMGDCPKQYLKFNNVEDEYRKKYAENEEHKKEYKDFDSFMKDYAGYEKDEKTGLYGYWENPNSKWDWYQVGGRWSGLLKLKSGTNSGNMVDSALIKDIDFEGMKNDSICKARQSWADAQSENPAIRYFVYGIEKDDTEESYISKQGEFTTFAAITPDGKWHEKGEMGWFGSSSETHEEAVNWCNSFKERFIDTADPECTLTIVDCHI